MLTCLVDDTIVARKLSSLEGSPMDDIQTALDTVRAANIEQLLAESISIEDIEEPAVAMDEDEAPVEAEEPLAGASMEDDAEEGEVLLDAFGQPVIGEEMEAEADPSAPGPAPEKTASDAGGFDQVIEDIDYYHGDEGEPDFELDRSKSKKKRRKDRQKRRQLILDEASGEVIAKRRRKGRRGSWDDETWEDYDY